MQLSHESYRTRWLILVIAWSIVGVVQFLQTQLVRDYLVLTNELSRKAPVANLPLTQIYPAFGADAQTWVRHALSLVEGHDLQLRHTDIDNAPYGREVHWNSAWAWSIVGAGKVRQLFTGEPLITAIERGTIWLTPFALFVLTVIISAWATRRAGVITGLIVTTAMMFNDRIYEGFFPSYVDHHGLLTVSVFTMMLGAVFMGGGWWRERAETDAGVLPGSVEAARSAAKWSGLCGAMGLWVSAASTLPPVALVGFAGLAVVLLQGRSAQAQGANFDPQVWRIWGRTGAIASLGFYLLEYFPRHMGLRLEANHPLYAIAWLGAGELIAEISARWLGPKEQRWTELRRLVLPVLLVCPAPLTILIGRANVFNPVFDTFMARLHGDYIQEFLPIWMTIRAFDLKTVFKLVGVDTLPMIAGIATLTYWRRETPIVVWFALIAAFFFNVMAWLQTRWLLNASGVQVCLAIVLVASWSARYRPAIRWAFGLGLIGLLYLPSGIMRFTGSIDDLKSHRVAPRDATGPLHRDVARALRESQPQGEITLLSSPNASTGVGYYGRFKTLGTLYWENHEGLKAAAAIYSARTEDEAKRLIQERKVTHIALISDENFVWEYFHLLHPQETVEDFKTCFGYRLLFAKSVPQWLQMIPYKVPDDLAVLKQSVLLFKVNFQQSVAEAIYNVAMGQITLGSLQEGEANLDILIKQAPKIYQPWLRKGELAIARKNWEDAVKYLLQGISLAPAAEHPALYLTYGNSFYNNGQPAYALGIYRTGFVESRSAELACYLAWIWSTATDDKLRNGKEALPLAEAAVKADPNNPLFLNSLAAALAENGRLPEAVQYAERALASAQLQNKADVAQASKQNLDTLKSGQPIRK